jgi:hypothetical protein
MSTPLDLVKDGIEGEQLEVLELSGTHDNLGSPYDREVEKRLVRKLDINFVSLLFVLCKRRALNSGLASRNLLVHRHAFVLRPL